MINLGPIPLTPETFSDQLLRAIVSCHWPIRSIDNIEFRRLIQCANKAIEVPSSTTMTRNLLEQRKFVENRIKEVLPKEPIQISIVLDCWSAPRRDGYIAIKAYWITDDWVLAEALIGFEPVYGNHTGEALGATVLKRLEEFRISSRIIALTSDNASNNRTLTEALNGAMSWLNKKLNIYKSITQVPCLAHVIQLAVQQLTGKIRITAKNDAMQKDWNEEEEVEELELARGPASEPMRVRLW